MNFILRETAGFDRLGEQDAFYKECPACHMPNDEDAEECLTCGFKEGNYMERWQQDAALSKAEEEWLEPDDEERPRRHPRNCNCPDCDDRRYHESRED